MSKIEKTENELQHEAASALLDEGIKFNIKGIGKLSIKPPKLCTLVEISKDALKVDVIEKGANTVNIIASSRESAVHASRIIAKAILRDSWKMKLFSGLLTRKLYNALTPKELYSLLLATVQQSRADFFLVSINLIGTMRIMKKKDTLETTVIGEQ